MREMTDEEKAARLAFYRGQAREQWNARQLARRTPLPWYVFYPPLIAASLALRYGNHWVAVALAGAISLAVVLVTRIEREATETSKPFRKSYVSRSTALTLLYLLCAAAVAVSVFDR